MKYQILTNGVDFIIKFKKGLKWNVVQKAIEQHFYLTDYTWSTEEEAQEWAGKEWGRSGTRVRKYRIC